MSDFIERLLESKAMCQQRSYTSGYSYGESWAQNHAEYSHLSSLANLRDSLTDQSYGFDDHFDESSCVFLEGLELSGWIAKTMSDTDFDSRNQVEDFWESVFGDDAAKAIHDPFVLKGFCDACLVVLEVFAASEMFDAADE
jgi:hypothetical protein